jgi:hypothetical protein
MVGGPRAEFMNSNVERTVRSFNQNCQVKPDVSREVKRTIREAMAFVAGALRCRPAPRDFWDDVNRNGAEFRNEWLDKIVIKCREALDAARSEGPVAQAETLQRIERLYAVLFAESVAGYELTSSGQLSALLCELAHDDADALTAAADAQHERSEANLEAVRFAAMRSIHTSEEVLSLASAELTIIHQPLARVASR